jgi:hypothetical protein
MKFALELERLEGRAGKALDVSKPVLQGALIKSAELAEAELQGVPPFGRRACGLPRVLTGVYLSSRIIAGCLLHVKRGKG